MRDREIDPVKVVDQNADAQQPCDAPASTLYAGLFARCSRRLQLGSPIAVK